MPKTAGFFYDVFTTLVQELLRLRHVYDLFFYCLGRKKTYKNKKKARCKVDLLFQRAFLFGASNRNRTCNLLITNQLHCQLCYTSGY